MFLKEHIWIESRENRLSGMLHISDMNKPLIVMTHGFTADKIGTNKFNLSLANYLEQSNFNVLRFDFLGSGDSDGVFEEQTYLGGWVEDLTNVLDWVSKNNGLNNLPIYLMGHSLGGCTILLQPTFKQLKIQGRILLSPVTYPKETFKEIIFGKEEWEKSLNGVVITKFLNKGFKIHSQFVKELDQELFSPIEQINKFKEPLLIIHGTEDAAVPYCDSLKLIEAYQSEKQLDTLQGSDHVYLGYEEQVMELVLNWLKKH